MPLDKPIYSAEENCKVYHDNINCPERNKMEMKNVRVGTGGKKLCPHCRTLNLEESMEAMKAGNLGLARQLSRGSELP